MKSVLEEKIIHRFGQPVSNPRDCELLSTNVFQSTGRNISPTTLRRFFGMLSSKSELSKYSLDTLAIYCAYAGYTDFCNEFRQNKNSESPEITEILDEAGKLTKYTLNSISRKSLTPFSNTISRNGVNENLDSFLLSGYTIFPLIAPGGYGKSVSIAHWIKMHQKDPDKLIILCQASLIIRLLNQGKQSSKKLNFNLADADNLFHSFQQTQANKLKRLVLVIDGVDEPENDSRGILLLAAFIRNASIQFHSQKFLKIILACRELSWNKFLLPELTSANPELILHSKVIRLESGSSNLPMLANTEVKEILDLHNKSHNKEILYDCIDWRLREMVRIPLNLYIFSSLISNSIPVSEITPDRLMLEYINTIVFKARFGEEKTDILWKIIEFSLENPPGYLVKKSQLKNIYPIHLRKESNYFPAYQDLLAMGILNEKKSQNKYGMLVTGIEFRHTSFYYYLTALYFVDYCDQINLSLFKKILEYPNNIEWTANVISYVYQLAYTHEEFDGIKDFCTLDESILSSLPVRHTVGNSFRQANNIRIQLIKKFAADPRGRIYFFEQFVDTNYIHNNFEYRIQEYLNHNKHTEGLLFGHSILFLADFLKLNLHGCHSQMEILENIKPDSEIHPWPIGRKVSASLYYHYIVEDSPLDDIQAYIHHYRKIAYGYNNYLKNGLIEFEMSIMVALVLIEEHELLIKLIDHASENYSMEKPSYDGFTWIHQHQNQLAGIFLDYAHYKFSGKLEDKTVERCEIFLNNYVSFFDDFQYLILINYFLFEYCIEKQDLQSAATYLQAALELSGHAKYAFFEAYIMSKGSILFPEYALRAKKMVKDSGFNPDSPSFVHA